MILKKSLIKSKNTGILPLKSGDTNHLNNQKKLYDDTMTGEKRNIIRVAVLAENRKKEFLI